MRSNKFVLSTYNFVFSELTIFFIAFSAMMGSLIFQYVYNLPPCALCITQRYFMYPIAFIAAVGILLRKKLYPLYLILGTMGGLVASYHVYIEQTGVPSALGACSLGQSCNEIVLELFGFLTIPMMSLGAFVAIIVISLEGIIQNKKKAIATES